MQGKYLLDKVLIIFLECSKGSSILYNLEKILSMFPSTTFAFLSNAIAIIAVAVYSPTPGNDSKTSLLLGINPLYFVDISFADSCKFFALL